MAKKLSAEFNIDKAALAAQMARTGHATPQDFVKEAVGLYMDIAEDMLITGRPPTAVDVAAKMGFTFDAPGLARIEAELSGAPPENVKGRALVQTQISSHVQVWLEEDERFSFLKSHTGHASFKDLATEAVGLYMDMIDAVAAGKIPAAGNIQTKEYTPYSAPGLNRAQAPGVR